MKQTQKKMLVDGIGKTMLCANAFHAILVDFIDQKKTSMLLKVCTTVLMIYRHIPTKLRSNILSFNLNSVLLFT